MRCHAIPRLADPEGKVIILVTASPVNRRVASIFQEQAFRLADLPIYNDSHNDPPVRSQRYSPVKKKASEEPPKPSTDLEWVSAKLRALRLARGLKLQEMADRLGTVHSRISDTESGRYDVKVSTLLRMLDALGTTPNDFFVDKPKFKEIGEGKREATRKRAAKKKGKK